MTAHCALDRAARRVLDAAVRRLSLSARGYDRVRKVARTLADLGESDAIDGDAVAEALQFRMM
jgi:magnesium chelatase family protein